MAAPHFPSPEVQVHASDVPNDPLHCIQARLLRLCLVSHQQHVMAGWDDTSAQPGSPAHLLIYAEIWRRRSIPSLFTVSSHSAPLCCPDPLHAPSPLQTSHYPPLPKLGEASLPDEPTAHLLGLSWHLLMVKWFPPFLLFPNEVLTAFQDVVLIWCMM